MCLGIADEVGYIVSMATVLFPSITESLSNWVTSIFIWN